MNKDRRNWMAGLSAIGLTSLLPTSGDAAEQRQAKPLTTASLAKSLLTLADKAVLEGMAREAQAIYAAVKIVMDGSPVPCDTDADCERKNPRRARQGGRQ